MMNYFPEGNHFITNKILLDSGYYFHGKYSEKQHYLFHKFIPSQYCLKSAMSYVFNLMRTKFHSDSFFYITVSSRKILTREYFRNHDNIIVFKSRDKHYMLYICSEYELLIFVIYAI